MVIDEPGTTAVPAGVLKRVVGRLLLPGGGSGAPGGYGAVAGSASGCRWVGRVVDAVAALPWVDVHPAGDGRRAVCPAAVGDLLWLLAGVLGPDASPPTSLIPTWLGGVTAEWHLLGVDLEVTVGPDGTAGYFYSDGGTDEREGMVGGDLGLLRELVGLLPLV